MIGRASRTRKQKGACLSIAGPKNRQVAKGEEQKKSRRPCAYGPALRTREPAEDPHRTVCMQQRNRPRLGRRPKRTGRQIDRSIDRPTKGVGRSTPQDRSTDRSTVACCWSIYLIRTSSRCRRRCGTSRTATACAAAGPVVFSGGGGGIQRRGERPRTSNETPRPPIKLRKAAPLV